MRSFTRSNMGPSRRRWVGAVAGLSLGIPVGAAAATLRVSNTGVDTVACGPVDPCRSITRAVANAVDGDTILVGPGFYADDLDNDDVFNEPGEEASGGVVIAKRLTVLSTLGASSTFVRHSGAHEAFDIRVGDVEVGRRNRGFTIRTSHHGVSLIGSSGAPIVDARVVGNVIVFESPVPAPVSPFAFESVSSRGRIEHNRIVGTGHPCGAYVSFESAGNRGNCGVQNNTGTTIQATGNYWGAPTGPGPDPADASCVFNPGSITVTVPFLTKDPSKPQAAVR